MLLLQFVLISILALFSGCKPQVAETQKKDIRINISSEPATLDPGKIRHLSGMILARALFEGLTRINAQDEPDLALAEKYELSEDGKTYTFHLRSSKWTNGEPVTAEDFVYAWKRILNPNFPGDQAFQLYPIKNALAVKKGEASLDALGVKAIDSLTLQVELEVPIPYFLKTLSLPAFYPINAKAEKNSPFWAENAETYVSNGPFLLKKWEHQNIIVMEKNVGYWDAKAVKLNAIQMPMVNDEHTELEMFEKNELDWAGSPISTIPLDAIPDLKKKNILHSKPLMGTALIRINTLAGPLNRVELRRALSLSLNRKEILEGVTLGTQKPAIALLPVTMKLTKEPYFKDGSVEEARLLFPKNEKQPEITLLYASSQRSHLIAQAIQQQWADAFNIHVKLEGVESKVYFARVSKKDYQLAMGSLIGDFDDPVTFLDIFKYKSVGSNNTEWENPEYAQLLEKAKNEKDVAIRNELLSKSEQILMQEMPIIPIFHFNMLYLKNEKIEGLILSSLGILDFKEAYIQ